MKAESGKREEGFWMLVDNGSLRPESYLSLRAVAAGISGALGREVVPVSMGYSDAIPNDEVGGESALTVEPVIREQHAKGVRSFTIVPFFIARGGGIVALLKKKLLGLQEELDGLSVEFTPFLYDEDREANTCIAEMLVDRIRDCIATNKLNQPSVIVVDHGSPKREAAEVRDKITLQVAALLRGAIASISPASMERRNGEQYDFNEPLLERQLRVDGFNRGDVVVAQLFLSPGKHAGAGGDIEAICREAESKQRGLRVHRTELLGIHPKIVGNLARLCKG